MCYIFFLSERKRRIFFFFYLENQNRAEKLRYRGCYGDSDVSTDGV